MDTLSKLSNKRIPIGIFGSPQPPYKSGDYDFPSRITPEIYQKLAELGVTVVYGLTEAIGEPYEILVFQALEYAEKAGITYLVRDMITYEYISLGHRDLPDWRTLSKKEKENLDNRYRNSLRRYKNYPAFGGVLFGDEPGTDSFEGIAAAKKIFEEECPGKLFYVNNLPYNAQPEQMQYGACMDGIPAATDKALSTDNENSERYYYFMERFINDVNPQVFSYDSYPFFDIGNIHTMIYISMYELPQICHEVCKKHNIPYWMFLQIGGQWEGSTARITDFAEVLLQVNLALAYAANGIQLFPGCFPNGWIGDDVVEAGIFDKYGKETDHYHYLKIALKQVKACEAYLTESSLKSIRLVGEFNGLLPSEEEMQKIQWNETIFRGVLPEAGSLLDTTERIPEFTASSQFLISRFDYHGKRLFYAVNNSIAVAANFKINFGKNCKTKVVYKGKEKNYDGNVLEFYRVAPGDGIMILC